LPTLNSWPCCAVPESTGAEVFTGALVEGGGVVVVVVVGGGGVVIVHV
jgi:hypothetical protein